MIPKELKESYFRKLLEMANEDLKIQHYEINFNGNVEYYLPYEAFFFKHNPTFFNYLLTQNHNRTKIFNLKEGIFEIVFDIDIKNDVNENEKNDFLNKVVEKLKSLGINKFYIWHSGGNGFHIHMFFEIKNLEEIQKFQPNEIQNYIIEHFKKIIEDLNKLNPNIQIETQQLSFDKWIRMEGSINPKKNQPKLCLIDGKLTFPQNIELNDFVINVRSLEQKVEETKKKLEAIKVNASEISKRDSIKIWWIEELLQTPLTDGRERVINLVLSPYLMNYKNLDPETAKLIILNWLNECSKLKPLKSRLKESYIIYQLKYAKENGLKPLSLQKALNETLADVKEFVEKFSNYQRGYYPKLKEIYEVIKNDVEQIRNFEDFLIEMLDYYIYEVKEMPFVFLKILYLIYKNRDKLKDSKLMNHIVNVEMLGNTLGIKIGFVMYKFKTLESFFFNHGKEFETAYRYAIRKKIIEMAINRFFEKLKQLEKFSKKDIEQINSEVKLFNSKRNLDKFVKECLKSKVFSKDGKYFKLGEDVKMDVIKRIVFKLKDV